MRVETVTALVTAAGALIVGSATAWAALRSANLAQADKLLQAMKDEAALLAELPEGSEARRDLQAHLEWMTKRYVPERAVQVQVKVDKSYMILGLLLGTACVALIYWMVRLGGWALWALVLLVPLFLVSLYGFVFEASGGDSRERLMSEAAAADGKDGAE
ncbi:hypothetical protein [Streptomyces sp. SCL15-4]|uniref:hypothetical protein n=1 Tax=Streptomyces sp. SCL15-4 TaxID=2967221 RepID=UPI0029668D62|nr:hypothetical protein [Streptomyces sp. SCL15-4]